MSETPRDESQAWSDVKHIIGHSTLTLGEHWSFNLRTDPKRFAFVLSRYKFAAKMACAGRSVIELGCSEGLGTPILAEFATAYLGVDMDAEAIEAAKTNWSGKDVRFECHDFLGKQYGSFGAAVSLDVVEHIRRDVEPSYFDTIAANLDDDGIAVVGTPNKTSDAYASPMSKAGHINLFEGPRLYDAMRRIFHNVFIFGINDEVVHTGFTPMAHYLVAVGCNKRD